MLSAAEEANRDEFFYLGFRIALATWSQWHRGNLPLLQHCDGVGVSIYSEIELHFCIVNHELENT